MKDLDDAARAFLPLTPAVFHILLAVADGDRHGLGIMSDVEERTQGAVKLGPGTLYGTIKRMMLAKLLKEAKERPAPAQDDPRRRYYAITALGRRAAELEAERLAALLGIAREKKIFPETSTR
jgi:DNA-binding PadR family transcriptional regulator